MKFIYNMSKEDLKKMYVKDFQKINMFYLIVSLVLYIIFNFELIKYNFVMMIILYLVVAIILLVLLTLASKVYSYFLIKNYDQKYKDTYGLSELIVDENGIYFNNKSSLFIDWDSVKKVKYAKTKVYIFYDKNDHIIINKEFLKKTTEFKKIIEIIKKYK